MARRRDRRRGAAPGRKRRSRLGGDTARLGLRRADRGDHPALRGPDGSPLLRAPPLAGRGRRSRRRLRRCRAARAAGWGRERRRGARARCDDLRVGRRLAVRPRCAPSEQPAAVRGDADACSVSLPRRRRLRNRGSVRRSRELVRRQAADRFHVPRPDRVADRILGLRVAAEERPHLGRRDVRVRQSGRGSRARNGVPERDDRLVDDRRRGRDRDRRRPDRDCACTGRPALP